MKEKFGRYTIPLLTFAVCAGLLIQCQRKDEVYPELPFPEVITLSALVVADDSLVITFAGEIIESLPGKDLDAIEEYGFVYSDVILDPVIENSVCIKAPPPDSGLRFFAKPDASGFDPSRPYVVRAYVILERNSQPIYSNSPRTLSLTGALSLNITDVVVRNDTVTAGAELITDLVPDEIVVEYGHFISLEPDDTIGTMGSILVVDTLSNTPLPGDLKYKSELVAKYKTDYWIRAVAILENGSQVFSLPQSFGVRGGFNRVKDIPESFKAGIAVVDEVRQIAYVGAGRKLYTAARNDLDIEWDSTEIPLHPDINSEVVGASGFILDGILYVSFGATQDQDGQRDYFGFIYSYDPGSAMWTKRTGVPLNSPREAAIALPFDDEIAYFGFGADSLPTSPPKFQGRNSFFAHHGGDSISTVCQNCPPMDGLYPYGQVAEILEDGGKRHIYMVGGTNTGSSPTSLYGTNMSQMIIFTPPQNGQSASWRVETPSPYPKRRNAASFVLDNTMYIAFGNESVNGFFKDIWKYSPNGGFEQLSIPFPGVARRNAIAFVLDGQAFIGGGQSLDGRALTDLWRFTPPE